MKSDMGRDRGFTILESLIVLAILAILTMVCLALAKARFGM